MGKSPEAIETRLVAHRIARGRITRVPPLLGRPLDEVPLNASGEVDISGVLGDLRRKNKQKLNPEE